MAKLAPADFAKVREVVAEVESKTRGEIVPLIVADATDYRWVRSHATLIGAAVALAIAEIGSHWRMWPLDAREVVWAILGGALAGAILGSIPYCARRIIGESRLARDVHRRALAEFTARGCGHTREETGILVMIALFERRIEIIADRGIQSVAVEKKGAGVWDGITADFARAAGAGRAVDGLTEVIRKLGAVLAEYFPPTEIVDNELPNDLQTEE